MVVHESWRFHSDPRIAARREHEAGTPTCRSPRSRGLSQRECVVEPVWRPDHGSMNDVRRGRGLAALNTLHTPSRLRTAEAHSGQLTHGFHSKRRSNRVLSQSHVERKSSLQLVHLHPDNALDLAALVTVQDVHPFLCSSDNSLDCARRVNISMGQPRSTMILPRLALALQLATVLYNTLVFGQPDFGTGIIFDGPCERQDIGPCNRSVAHFVLGGLFPVHSDYDAERQVCGSTYNVEALQWVEAFRHAVDLVNANASLLPGLRLGYGMRDTCGSDRQALRHCLTFVGSGYCRTGDATELPDPDEPADPNIVRPLVSRVAGVVGPYSSPEAISVTDLMRLFEVPVVSYSATSPQLSDKDRFPYFLRTTPSDRISSRAVVGLARKLGWGFINIINTDDSFGNAGAESVAEQFTKADSRFSAGCVGSQAKGERRLSHPPSEDEVRRAWRMLLESSPQNKSNGVVLFTQSGGAREFFKLSDPTLRQAALSRNLTFVGVGAWGDVLDAVRTGPEIARGSVSAVAYRPPIEEFDRHFGSLNPITTKGNPWLVEGWQTIFNCDLGDTRSNCSQRNLTDPRYYKRSSKVPFIYDAVFAFAHAFHNIYVNNCNRTRCDALRSAPLALEALQKVTFASITGDQFRFDANGDPVEATYAIKNMVVDDEQSQQIKFPIVGFYRRRIDPTQENCSNLDREDCFDESLDVDLTEIVWNDGSHNAPGSKCSEQCVPGQYHSVGNRALPCCWDCRRCALNRYSRTGNTSVCPFCKDDQRSVSDRSFCESVRVVQWDSSEAFAIVVAIMASTGIAVIIGCLIWMATKRRCFFPLGIEPTVICLASFLLIYASLMFELNGPSRVICGMKTVATALGFTTVFSNLLVYACYRYCVIFSLPEGGFLFNTQRRAIASLVFVTPVALLLLLSMVAKAPDVNVEVTRFEKEERSCKMLIADEVLPYYNFLLSLLLFTICARTLKTERKEEYCYLVDERPRVLYFTAIASIISMFLYICTIIILAYIDSSPVAFGGVVNVFFWLVNTSMFLIVFTQQLRQLNFLDAAEERWLRNLHTELVKASSKSRTWRTGTFISTESSSRRKSSAATKELSATKKSTKDTDAGTSFSKPPVSYVHHTDASQSPESHPGAESSQTDGLEINDSGNDLSSVNSQPYRESSV